MDPSVLQSYSMAMIPNRHTNSRSTCQLECIVDRLLQSSIKSSTCSKFVSFLHLHLENTMEVAIKWFSFGKMLCSFI